MPATRRIRGIGRAAATCWLAASYATGANFGIGDLDLGAAFAGQPETVGCF